MIKFIILISASLRIRGFRPRMDALRYSRSDHIPDFELANACLGPSFTKKKALPTTTRRVPWTILEQVSDPSGSRETIDKAWGAVYRNIDPMIAECSYVCDDIEGEVPLDLKGILYRNGPGNFERGGQRYNHILDGDGFIASFAFLDGKVKYTGKFVGTEGYREEKKQNKLLRRNVFGTEPLPGRGLLGKITSFFDKLFDIQIKNVANHHVVEWGDRLFALWEGGRAHELDPVTLETLSNVKDGPAGGLTGDHIASATLDHGGWLDKLFDMVPAFTNHPHAVDNNTLVAFLYLFDILKEETIVQFIEYDEKWNQKQPSVTHRLTGSPMGPHDFVVTDDYYIFFETRFVEVGQLSFILGLQTLDQLMSFDIQKPSVLHLVPRNQARGLKPLRIEGPPYLNLHMFQNAQVVGNTLTLYSHGWDLSDQRFFPSHKQRIPFFEQWGGFFPNLQESPPGRLWRTVVDLSGNGRVTSHEQVVSGLCMEESIIDSNYPNKVYGTCSSDCDVPMPPTGYVSVDVTTNEDRYWWADRNCFVGEPIAVRKRNGEAGSWLLGLEYCSGGVDHETKQDGEEKGASRTSVIVLDSERLEEGPVCRVNLNHFLSYGTHGSFAQDISVIHGMFGDASATDSP